MSDLTDLFSSTRPPDGGAYTLTTYFGELLFDAEQRFGARETSWTPIGVEFFPGNAPHIWFSGDRKHVCIRLTYAALNNRDEALFQLAHEVIHILSPVKRATNLEEGVATQFSLSISHYKNPSYPLDCLKKMESERSSYYLALKDFELLHGLDNDVTKKLRERSSSLSKISYSDIMETTPACDPMIAKRLCEFPK